jgi:2,4-didehydro-3-deoxy-L-rhamnonate hydrolase
MPSHKFIQEVFSMKLLRYGAPGAEKSGLLDDKGQIRDLSAAVGDIGTGHLSPTQLKRLQAMPVDALPVVKDKVRLGVPYLGIGKFIAVGLNYRDHAIESNLPIPKEPVLFTKAISCLQGPDDDVMLPEASVKTDWEVELGIVIGTRARYVAESDALKHVAGYCLVNDVSEREYQIERGGTWDKGKGCDTFGPVGPWLVTADEIGDPQDLQMHLDVNGQRMQTGNTKTMIFGAATLISYISRFMTLMPGDLITTGTPPGVGMAKKPNPIYLKAGDVMELGISKLGTQRQTVIPFSV